MVVCSCTQENSLKTLIQRAEHIPLMGPHTWGEGGRDGEGGWEQSWGQTVFWSTLKYLLGITTDIMAIDIKLTVFFDPGMRDR